MKIEPNPYAREISAFFVQPWKKADRLAASGNKMLASLWYLVQVVASAVLAPLMIISAVFSLIGRFCMGQFEVGVGECLGGFGGAGMVIATIGVCFLNALLTPCAT